MSLFAVSPNLQGISNAVEKAAGKIGDPQADAQLVARQLVSDIAKALDPSSATEATLDRLINNGIDDRSKLALGAFTSVFKLGLEMSFSGVINQGISSNFTTELLKHLAPEAMLQLESLTFSAGLDAFRPWRHS